MHYSLLQNECYLFFIHVPKSGYINANDFATPRGLAKYLKYLDLNKTAYNAYFNC